MFKKSKKKMSEQVKNSPRRLQQLTQSVSDRLQISVASNENFFSRGEDDANTSNLEPSFSSVPLMYPQEAKFKRNSNSSVARDVSFLPRYESSPNVYHLQSNLDVSAREIGDNVSKPVQLRHLSKKQIYSAFQKAQMRYHKYRRRYTDLAKHYKDLERENGKMKSVLVETQDKAIRRVTELKEQCSLEQKAKAHLERALRTDIDEKQFKIQSLQTKIELLQNRACSSSHSESLDSYETDVLKMEQFKIELQTANQSNSELNIRLKEAQDKLESVRKQAKMSLLSLTSKISEKIGKEFEEKEEQLKKDFRKKIEDVSSNTDNRQEILMKLMEKDDEVKQLREEYERLLEDFSDETRKYDNLEHNHLELIEDCVRLRKKVSTLEKDLSVNQNESQVFVSKIFRLEANIEALQKENENYKKTEEEKLQQDQEISSLKAKIQNFEEEKEGYKKIEAENLHQNETISKLQKEKILQIEEISSLRATIRNLEEKLQQNEYSCSLKATVHNLEEKMNSFRSVEDKLQKLEDENKNLFEKLQTNEDYTKKIANLEAKIQHLEGQSEENLQKLEKEETAVMEKLAESDERVKNLSLL